MYGHDHQCEVSRSNLDDVRYSLERQIEEMGWRINAQQDSIEALRLELSVVQEGLHEIQTGLASLETLLNAISIHLPPKEEDQP